MSDVKAQYASKYPDLFFSDTDEIIKQKIRGFFQEGLERLEESLTDVDRESPYFAPHVGVRVGMDVDELLPGQLEFVHGRLVTALSLAMEVIEEGDVRLVGVEFYALSVSSVTSHPLLCFRLDVTHKDDYPLVSKAVSTGLDEFSRMGTSTAKPSFLA